LEGKLAEELELLLGEGCAVSVLETYLIEPEELLEMNLAILL